MKKLRNFIYSHFVVLVNHNRIDMTMQVLKGYIPRSTPGKSMSSHNKSPVFQDNNLVLGQVWELGLSISRTDFP
jgi:hypothetical protein